jgi:hypothetical protein
MKLFKIVYTFIGIALTALVVFYAMTGFPMKDRELYNAACALDDRAANEIWPNLRVGEYPLAIRKGSSEYVVQGTEIIRRKPVLPVIACTAYPVGDEVNVFLPCKSEMDSIGQIAEGLSADVQHFFINRFSMNSKKLTDSQYIAFIYHETMHAFQQKYFSKKLQAMQNEGDDSGIEELPGKLETDPLISSLYNKQVILLGSIAGSLRQDINRDMLREYFSTREAVRKAYETKAGEKNAAMIKKYIDFYELFEGTARYAELKTAGVLADNGLELQYLSSLQEMAQGKEKYYRSGMAMCLLLDKVSPEWKESAFSGDSTLADILEKAMEDF